jgi:hypothetical protein
MHVTWDAEPNPDCTRVPRRDTIDDLDPVLPNDPHTDLLRVTTMAVVGQDLNLRPPASTRSYGVAWRIVDLLGSTRRDLAVSFRM